MSSQSSVSSELFDDQDEICSCGTYSSGWERSSVSDYFDSTDTEESFDDNDFCANGEFYTPPKKTGKPTLFDMEYKCELVVLPNPYIKPIKTEEKAVVVAPVEVVVEEPKTIANPWKNIKQTTSEDPWKFLEEINKPIKKAIEPKKEEKKKHQQNPNRSSSIDNSNTNKLCKYKDECRMNKNNNCSMVHSLSAWKPRICRFNNACKRKNLCGYYHTNTPIQEYLKIMMKTTDTIYAKNSTLYEKYL